MHLSKSYFLQEDVVFCAKDLLGKEIHVISNGIHCSGLITETEAYAGITDKASHAYGNKRTNRTEIMYQEGGVAYVYLIYGIYHLFNFVSNHKDIPHAILLRGIYPRSGIEFMETRLGRSINKIKHTNGPGRAAKALGINKSMNGISLCGDIIWVEDHNLKIKKNDIGISSRIGVDYAKEDAALPYRFFLKDHFIKNSIKKIPPAAG